MEPLPTFFLPVGSIGLPIGSVLELGSLDSTRSFSLLLCFLRSVLLHHP